MPTEILSRCLVCNDDEPLIPVLDLGQQPLANTYYRSKETLPEYELKVNYCPNCYHCQLSQAVDANDLYIDYKYVSGTTETLKAHFKEVAQFGAAKAPVDSNSLDIGCNDGSLMEAIIATGAFAQVVGIDPAFNLDEVTREKGLNVVCNFFPTEGMLKSEQRYGFITALNCVAHNPYPRKFLSAIGKLLAAGGVALIEFPYVGNTLELRDLGQFYHEHHSYFSIESFAWLASISGLRIANIKFFKHLHGGTIRFVLNKEMTDHYPGLYETWLPWERNAGHLNERFKKFSDELNQNVGQLRQMIWTFHREGRPVIAYGASAKSATLFNLPEMRSVAAKIKYVVDDNKLKQRHYCPGSQIFIESPSKLKEEVEPVIVLTVHNFKAEVLQRLRDMGIKGTLLNYTPEVYCEEI